MWQVIRGIFLTSALCTVTVVVLAFSIFPFTAHAENCENVLSSASGYLFDSYEVSEYSPEGWLIIHLKVKPPFNDGRGWTLNAIVWNDECERGTRRSYGSTISLTPDIEFWSIRFVSPTEYEIWNDEDELLITSRDIDVYPGYYEVSFNGRIGLAVNRFSTKSYRIFNNADDPPVRTETLSVSEACTEQEFRAGGYLFDDYEHAEYIDGLLVYHFRLKSPFNDGRMWRSRLRRHDENCAGELFPRPPQNTSIKPYSRYYSVRFSSPTHYDIWNDETNQIEICPECSVDVLDDPTYVSFHSQIDTSPNFLHSTPFPISESDYMGKPDPVIIIPGILGSWEKNGELVIDPVFHTYDNLIETLELNGFVQDENLFTFPYNWRQSNVFTAGLLRDRINEVQEICECDKVDLVAHSMGGLVARYYIQSGLYEDDIDQLVFLGTPHLGSPKSYLTWEGGRFGNRILDRSFEYVMAIEARRNNFSDLFSYIRNLPIISVQQLLPTFDYIRDKDTGILRSYPTHYPLNTFLENLNVNITNLFDSGVDITNIVGNLGDGSTITALSVIDSPEPPKWEYGYPENFDVQGTDRDLILGSGDETVPSVSGEFIGIDLNEFASGHTVLVKDSQGFIFEKLTGEIPTEVSETDFGTDVPLLLINVLSPVDVQVIAPDGKIVGKDFETGEEVNEINGAFYSGFLTDNEYITIPNPLNGDYTVMTEGMGDGGEYTIAVGYIDNEILVESEITSYILPGTNEEINFDLDTAGDIEGKETTVITPEILILHIEQAYMLGWITNEDYKTNLQNIVQSIVNSKGSNLKSVIKVLQKRLDNGLKDRFINEDGYNLLREDIINLIFTI